MTPLRRPLATRIGGAWLVLVAGVRAAGGSLPETAKTPPEVAAAIADVIGGKSVTDVGCGDGDFLLALSKHAGSVHGIEWNGERAAACRGKGLDVVHGDATKVAPPRADVYYLWVHRLDAILANIPCGTFVFGPIEGNDGDAATVRDLARAFPSEVRNVPTSRGAFRITIVTRPCEIPPSPQPTATPGDR